MGSFTSHGAYATIPRVPCHLTGDPICFSVRRMISPLFQRPSRNLSLLLGGLLLAAPRPARAEDAISYQYEDYREAGGRIGVDTQSAHLEKDLGPDWRFKLEGVTDAISGATPSGQPAPAGSDQVPLTIMHEHRKAWNADLGRQFSRVNVDVGVADSRESDYVSKGWSLNTLTDFNQKNTTLLAGVAGTDDDVKVFFQPQYLKKWSNDVILGVTQLLDPQTSVSFNVTWSRATGYLSDPYKLVQKNVQVLPGIFLLSTFGENRPNERNKWIALASVNRAFPEVRGAIDASYRYYQDTFGTRANTLDLSWLQRLGGHFILTPHLRFYDQSASDFYYYSLDQAGVVPFAGRPRPQGPFYSSDYRLSAFRSYTYGLKAVWQATDRLQVDAGLEEYEMRGRDGVTPQSAYCRARIVTGGVKLTW
jgi:Protein of unknown function (DUF3570)